MNPMQQFYFPPPPYPGFNGPPFNPQYNPQTGFSSGTQVNPYLNSLFDITNMYQAQFFNEAALRDGRQFIG